MKKSEIKKLIKKSVKEIKEQAYGHATLTSQGQSIHRAPGVWETDPLGDEDRKQEDLIRMMEQPGAPGEPQGGEEGKDKKPKVKEKPPKYSPEKIGECKAKCVDLELENFEIVVDNIEAKLQVVSQSRSDARPSEVEALEKERKELQKQLKVVDEQIEAKKTEKEKLLNHKKEVVKESQKKKNIKANVKKLWNDYAKSRINSSLRKKIDEHKKRARRKVLQEGVMQTFFEYFDLGHTNEEIVQLYAAKGVNVPEQFVSKARKQHEQYSKMQFELEMSEKAFKNDASQIVNNPGELATTMLDDDKQLASGLFNENTDNEAPDTPPEAGPTDKLKSDVKALERGIERIDQGAEWTQVFDKLMTKINQEEVTGITNAKVKAKLLQAIKSL